MKKSAIFKTIIASVAVAATIAFSAVFGGCFGSGAKDGVNGKDLNIYDLYEAAKAESGNQDMTMDEFLKEYLSYASSELEEAASLKAAVNRSLMSAVSVSSTFRKGSGTAAERVISSGSGVIIDIDREKGDMTVLTNCHVVYNAEVAAERRNEGYSTDISVWLYGYESAYVAVNNANAIDAEIIAASKTYDVALLKIAGSSIVKNSKAVAAKWSQSEDVYLGETVYTLGNAQSQQLSANIGYIAKDIEQVIVNLGSFSNPDNYKYEVIRTSAPVYSGNSGGGFYDINGELLGLVNANSPEDSLDGMGYALTGSRVRRVVARMLAEYTGVETHGVSLANHGISVLVTDSYSTGLNEKGFAEICERVEVSSVSYSSPANGKIKSGDVINNVKIIRNVNGAEVTVENVDVRREHNFKDVMLAIAPDDMVKITFTRGGAQQEPVTFSVSRFENIV